MAKHYIGMLSMPGCLPDYVDVFTTKAGAIESLTSLLDVPLNGRVAKELRKYGLASIGHQHVEVAPCTCRRPGDHSDD